MAIKYSEEFIKKQVAKGFPEEMYRSKEWQKEQHYKKNNSMSDDMSDRVNGLIKEDYYNDNKEWNYED